MSTEKEQALVSLAVLLETCKSSLATLASLIQPKALNNVSAPVDILRKDALSLHRMIHTSVTRLSVSLGKPPPSYPVALVPLNELTYQVAQLTSCTISLPKGILRKEAVWAAEETIQALETLAQHFENHCRRDDIGGDGYLARTGAVHDAVVKADKLSNNETEAIVKAWKVNGEGLADSLREVNEIMEKEDGGEDDAEEPEDGWDELGKGFGGRLQAEEMDRVKKIYPLLRFTTILHEKILSHHILKPPRSQPYPETHLTSLLTFSNSLLLATDELVSNLYSPQDVESIQECVQMVHGLTKDLDEEMGVTKPDRDKIAEELAGLHLGSGSQTLTWFKKCFSQIDVIYNELQL